MYNFAVSKLLFWTVAKNLRCPNDIVEHFHNNAMHAKPNVRIYSLLGDEGFVAFGYMILTILLYLCPTETIFVSIVNIPSRLYPPVNYSQQECRSGSFSCIRALYQNMVEEPSFLLMERISRLFRHPRPKHVGNRCDDRWKIMSTSASAEVDHNILA